MKMRIIQILALVILAVLLVLFMRNSKAADPPVKRPVSLPYKDLSASDILSATVSIPPRGFQVKLSDDEIKKLVTIMRTIEIDSPDYNIEIEGKQTLFSLKMANGAGEDISAYNNVIYINGKHSIERHETKVANTLSELGKNIAEGSYMRFLEKSASGVYASSDSITRVAPAQIVIMRFDENQSIPYRWKPDISDDSLVRLVHDEIDSSKVDSNRLPGSGGEVRIFYFEALSAGECKIIMNYTDIRDDSMISETETYTIIIESDKVKGDINGQ